MVEKDMPGSGSSYVGRGVLRARPRRVEQAKVGQKKVRVLGLIVVLGLAGLADTTHSVVRGDNLSRIARRYGVSVRSLAAANGIKNVNLIKAGSMLRIPGRTPLRKPVAAVSASPGGRHRVVAGENLSRIAARYGTTVGKLVAMNGLAQPSLLRIGQMLSVPSPAAMKVAGAPAPAQAPPPPQVVAKTVAVPVQPPALPDKPPVTTATPPASSTVEDLIVHYSQKYKVDRYLMLGLAWQESGWKQHVVSSAGAIGVMQVMPQTGEFISRHLLKKPVNLNVTEQNIEAGVAFYAFYLGKTSGDDRTAVAGYFQGLRSVWQTGISERTKKYVDSVFALRGRFASL